MAFLSTSNLPDTSHTFGETSAMAHRTPRELIEIYWDQIYNAGEVELVREVCADPIIRHDPGCVLPSATTSRSPVSSAA